MKTKVTCHNYERSAPFLSCFVTCTKDLKKKKRQQRGMAKQIAMITSNLSAAFCKFCSKILAHMHNNHEVVFVL